MPGDFSLRNVLRETRNTIDESRVAVLLYLAVLTAIYSLLDVFESNLGSTILTVAAGYALQFAMLKKGGLSVPQGGKRLGAFFALSLLLDLGVLLGLALLIVPGIFLYVRWLPAYVLLLSEDKGVVQSLGESWDRTRGQEWPLATALLVGVSSLGVAFALVIKIAEATNQELVMTVGANFLGSAWMVFLTAVGIAAYRLVTDDVGELTEVFA